jgi:hypothetical protein
MLLNTQRYDATDIVSFKLVNGDEIVARVVQDTNEDFVIARPCTVMPSAKGIGLIQSLFTAEDNKNVHISRSHVMMHAPTIKEMRDHYIQTTTGIQTVSSPGLIV